MENKKANIYGVVVTLSVVAFLVLGSMLTSFNVIDCAYFIFLVYCILRYIYINKVLHK